MEPKKLYRLKGYLDNNRKTPVELKHCTKIGAKWYRRRYFSQNGDIHDMVHDSSNGEPDDIGFDYVPIEGFVHITEIKEEKGVEKLE